MAVEQVPKAGRRPFSFAHAVKGPLGHIGAMIALTLDTVSALFRRPFCWGEFLSQMVFLLRVSLLPAIMLAGPFVGFVVFAINQMLAEIGATDLAGAGVALAVVREIGPLASVMVVAGAGATAMCADLGARTIREELDAMEVLGVDPVHRLVLPRVLASVIVAMGLSTVVTIVGTAAGFGLSILQGSSAGQFMSSFVLLVNTSDYVVAEVKAAVWGFVAAIVACYRGMNVRKGPKAVGEAVNETVVIAFVVLFVLNTLGTALIVQLELVPT